MDRDQGYYETSTAHFSNVAFLNTTSIDKRDILVAAMNTQVDRLAETMGVKLGRTTSAAEAAVLRLQPHTRNPPCAGRTGGRSNIFSVALMLTGSQASVSTPLNLFYFLLDNVLAPRLRLLDRVCQSPPDVVCIMASPAGN